MSFCESFPWVKRFVRNLRGGSQPFLAEASDGRFYVVKFTNNLQGSNLLFNEAMGAELYRVFELPVPDWRPLMLTDSFIDHNPGCWIQTPECRLRPASGLCFGSRFLGEDDVRLFEILPRSGFAKVRNLRDFWLAWLIDICAGHADNRQVVYKEEDDGRLTAFFIDHGHMFGGPKGELQVHFRASRYLDSRIYSPPVPCFPEDLESVAGSLPAQCLWQKIDRLPAEWRSSEGLREFAKCMERFTKPDLLRNILDTMADSIQRSNVRNDGEFQPERMRPASLLRSVSTSLRQVV